MVAFFLNIPWTFIGLVGALLSIPEDIKTTRVPRALIISVRSLWWFPVRNAQGITFGHCVLVRSTADARITEHELVHVRQHAACPFFFWFMYAYELVRHGYWRNRYEVEAYNESDTWPPAHRIHKV